MYRAPDGLHRLAFRVANLRNHQVLQPAVRMLLVRRHGGGGGGGGGGTSRSSGGGTIGGTTKGGVGTANGGTTSFGTTSSSSSGGTAAAAAGDYSYVDLAVGGGPLWLGVPSVVAHTVDAASPLAGLSRAELAAADAEVVVLLDGIDESSGSAIQVRRY